MSQLNIAVWHHLPGMISVLLEPWTTASGRSECNARNPRHSWMRDTSTADRGRLQVELVNGTRTGSTPVWSTKPSFCSRFPADSWKPVRLRRFEQSESRRTRFPRERTVVGTAVAVEWGLDQEVGGARQNALCEGQDAFYVEFLKLAGVPFDPNERELLAQFLRVAGRTSRCRSSVRRGTPRPDGPACLVSPSRPEQVLKLAPIRGLCALAFLVEAFEDLVSLWWRQYSSQARS
jgi:hypothetical protein